jgi:hypothetical protein
MIFDKGTEYDYGVNMRASQLKQADFPYKACTDVGISGLEST